MSGEGNGTETQVLTPEPVAPMPEQSQVVAVPAVPPPTLAVTPQATAKDLIGRLDAIKEAQKEAMKNGVDYGVIPGTDKPTLLKPGAEKLAALFQLDVQPQNEKRWEADDHLTVISRVTIFHAPTGARLGSGEGVCTTRERKYAYRTANLTCPSCEEETVFRSKHPPRDNPDAEPGWFCWAKKGGCGANFAADDEKIAGQERGQVDNPDLPDLWNTVDKMATKRALVAAVLIVTGASAVFTQDVEDMADADLGGGGQGGATQKKAPPETKAHQRKSSERPITSEQKGKINALLAAAGLTAEQAGAVRVWFCVRAECAQFDRLPTKDAARLINELREDGSGAAGILDDLKVSASKGHEAATKILARMEGTDA